MNARGVLRILEGGLLAFWCDGCRTTHAVNSGWKFNGDFERPTFEPSVLVQVGCKSPRHKSGDPCWCTYNAEHPNDPVRYRCETCHSFVTNGQIQYLGDCTHALKGQTVPLRAF